MGNMLYNMPITDPCTRKADLSSKHYKNRAKTGHFRIASFASYRLKQRGAPLPGGLSDNRLCLEKWLYAS